MNISNIIANMIMELLEQSGETEIRRNELADTLGCVPSQINYVISSRFTPEQGYIVESRRGGGGYIKISRVKLDRGTMLMHVVNTVGDTLDEKTCRAHIMNLTYQKLLDERSAALTLAATSDTSLRRLSPQARDSVRASVFKQMLLTCMNMKIG